jgi:hypothetical protein
LIVDSCAVLFCPNADADGKGGDMTPRTLLRNPNLKLINDQAKNFLQDFHQGNVLALARYSLFESLPDTSNLRLADAQQMIAREYGYASWPKLKQHVDALARDFDTLEELVGL